MKNKKKLIIILIALLAAIALAVVVIKLFPYISLIKAANTLIKDNYVISAEYSINNIDTDFEYITELIPSKGQLYGEKSDDRLRLVLRDEGESLLEVYTGSDGQCLINLRHMCNILKRKVSDDELSSVLTIAHIFMGDVYISLEHTDTVLGTDYGSWLKGLGNGGGAEYSIHRIKSPGGNILEAEDIGEMTFFELYIETYDTNIIIGAGGGSGEEGRLYANVKSSAADVELMLCYDTAKAEDVIFPAEDFSDIHAELLRVLYRIFYKNLHS